jgi:uncharacterized membrane protein YfcA
VIDIIGYVLLGLVAGGLAATLGIGGGVVYVPALVSLFAFSQHTAQGTSLAIIVPTTIVATIAHARARRVLWPLMAIVAAAGVVGAVAGARTALIMDETLLRRIFAVVLVIIAVRMAVRAVSLFRASRAVDGG